MKHRRGIDLVPTDDAETRNEISVARFAPDGKYESVRFDMIAEWWVLGAFCLACRSYGEVDRDVIQRRHGRSALLHVAAKNLKCTGCGERGRAMFIVYGKLGR